MMMMQLDSIFTTHFQHVPQNMNTIAVICCRVTPECREQGSAVAGLCRRTVRHLYLLLLHATEQQLCTRATNKCMIKRLLFQAAM